jgi:hypothetical protein
MKFNSIREYFYKLYNVLYSLVLLPLAVFIFLYLQMQSGELEGHYRGEQQITTLLLIIIGIVVLIDWILSVILYNHRLKSVRTIESLGEKLSNYYKLTVLRFAIVITGLLILAGGFYLTENQVFTGMFVVSLGILSLLWPLPAKICRDLKLRGDERLMVLHKKEKLY